MKSLCEPAIIMSNCEGKGVAHRVFFRLPNLEELSLVLNSIMGLGPPMALLCVHVYCGAVTGGWVRVACLDKTNSSIRMSVV